MDIDQPCKLGPRNLPTLIGGVSQASRLRDHRMVPFGRSIRCNVATDCDQALRVDTHGKPLLVLRCHEVCEDAVAVYWCHIS